MTIRGLRVAAAAASAVAIGSSFGLTAAARDADGEDRVARLDHAQGTAVPVGNVSSSKAACVSGRKVTLLRTNGNVLGTATTASSGRWQIAAPGSAGITLGPLLREGQATQRRHSRNDLRLSDLTSAHDPVSLVT